MGSLRQYFETDFRNAVRINVRFDCNDDSLEAFLLYDLLAFTSYLACYITGANRDYHFFSSLLKCLQYGKTAFQLNGSIVLPSAKLFPGELIIENKSDFEIGYKFHGEINWRSTKDIKSTTRIYIYSETNLPSEELARLDDEAGRLGHDLVFRSSPFVDRRTYLEKPLAFISHDSRDKQVVARPIAEFLQNMICPIWFDEYSLHVGDKLRDSIEKGLKECQKCILVLSPNFFSNNGWTKKEFDSIFTRELLEETNLILPVWYQVTKEQVFDYSPSLLNIKGLDWVSIGEEKVCRALYKAIMDS